MSGAVVGAVIGGRAAIVSAAVTKIGDSIATRSRVEHETRKELAKELLAQRRDLYAKFISTTTAAQLDSSAIDSDVSSKELRRAILGVLDQIQITSSRPVRIEAMVLFNLFSLPTLGFDHERIGQQRLKLLDEIRKERRLDDF